jgi:hypothetical protein
VLSFSLTLYNSYEDLFLLEILKYMSLCLQTVTVKEDGVGSVFFPILPTALGKIPLHATARSSAAADSVQRDILIEVF